MLIVSMNFSVQVYIYMYNDLCYVTAIIYRSYLTNIILTYCTVFISKYAVKFR